MEEELDDVISLVAVRNNNKIGGTQEVPKEFEWQLCTPAIHEEMSPEGLRKHARQ